MPSQKFFTVGVGGEAVDGMNFSIDCNLFAKDPDRLLPINNLACQSSFFAANPTKTILELRSHKMMFEMVLNASTSAHASAS